jgi:2-keto-4-pentenoate hydratase/2-oxohepta-3-ene-1,7-dioic acid hydratase in catechol pathway
VKLVTYSPSTEAADDRAAPTRVGVLAEAGIRDLTEHLPQPEGRADVGRLLGLEPATLRLMARAVEATTAVDPATVRIRAPLLPPGKMIAVGLNYHGHSREQQRPPPDYPLLFAILPNAVVGPGEPVVRPRATNQLDIECELGVVIGHRATKIGPSEADSVIFGYTIVNDVTARDLQREDRQWLRAKSSDGFAPMGPVIVTADELRLPVRLRAMVNDETWQDASTDDMVFDVASLVAFVSRTVTLEPGDVILTGTPAGVGHFHQPPRYLADGDLMRCEIEGIGVLENPIVDESPRTDDHDAVAGMGELLAASQ